MSQHIATFLILGKEGLFPPETLCKILRTALNGHGSVRIDNPHVVHPGCALTISSSRDPFFEGAAGSAYTIEYGVERACSIAFDFDREGNQLPAPRYYGNGQSAFQKFEPARLRDALLEGVRASQQYARGCQSLEGLSLARFGF